MILEEYIDKGILLKQLLSASRRVSITFDNGLIRIGNTEIGTDGMDYTDDILIHAIEVAYGR